LETYTNLEETEDSDIFLNEDPYIYLSRGNFNRVPYIIGLTANEGLLVNAAGSLKNMYNIILYIKKQILIF
jgi:hypothetical protein